MDTNAASPVVDSLTSPTIEKIGSLSGEDALPMQKSGSVDRIIPPALTLSTPFAKNGSPLVRGTSPVRRSSRPVRSTTAVLVKQSGEQKISAADQMSTAAKQKSFQDQRICIKMCVRNQINCTNTMDMLRQCFGDSCMQERVVRKWYKRFQDGRESVEDDERIGRSKAAAANQEKVSIVQKQIIANPRVTIREVAAIAGISYNSTSAIFSEVLGVRRMASKFVPKSLTFQQRLQRKEIAEEMLEQVDNDPKLLQRIITGDETWVYACDHEAPVPTFVDGEPTPKKPRQAHTNARVLLTVFFDCRGIVHHELLTQGTKANTVHYMGVMRRLREAVRTKRSDIWKNWRLHHDIATVHNSLNVREFLAEHETVLIPQPQFSPDLNPFDYFLFPKMKKAMKTHDCMTLEDIEQTTLKELRTIPDTAFEKCFKDLYKRWHWCVSADGDYFEKDE